MAVQDRLYTVEEFWAISQLPENENKRLELIDGEIVEMASSSNKNTIIAGRLIRFLGSHVDVLDLGYVTVPDGGFQLGPRIVRLPDVAYISKERAGNLDGKFFPVAPDLAVEVISPSETYSAVRKKTLAYLNAGTRLVWTVDPEDKTISVHRLADDGGLITHTFDMNDTLDGGDVLPGFSLKVSEIFDRL